MHINNFCYNVLPSTISGENWQNKRKTERNLTQLLRISAVCNWFVFVKLRMMCFNELLGMSFTMCHLTGKQPVHLSCCQYSTVLLKSTRPTISARPRNYPAGVNLENRGRQVTSTFNLTHRFTEGKKGSLIEDKDQTYRKQQEHRTTAWFSRSLLISSI